MRARPRVVAADRGGGAHWMTLRAEALRGSSRLGRPGALTGSPSALKRFGEVRAWGGPARSRRTRDAADRREAADREQRGERREDRVDRAAAQPEPLGEN